MGVLGGVGNIFGFFQAGKAPVDRGSSIHWGVFGVSLDNDEGVAKGSPLGYLIILSLTPPF